MKHETPLERSKDFVSINLTFFVVLGLSNGTSLAFVLDKKSVSFSFPWSSAVWLGWCCCNSSVEEEILSVTCPRVDCSSSSCAALPVDSCDALVQSDIPWTLIVDYLLNTSSSSSFLKSLSLNLTHCLNNFQHYMMRVWLQKWWVVSTKMLWLGWLTPKLLVSMCNLFCTNLGPHVFEDAKIVLSALSINYWVWIFVLAGSRAKWYLAIIVIMGFLVEPCKATHTVIHNTISLFALSSQHSWWAQVKEKYNHIANIV